MNILHSRYLSNGYLYGMIIFGWNMFNNMKWRYWNKEHNLTRINFHKWKGMTFTKNEIRVNQQNGQDSKEWEHGPVFPVENHMIYK